MYYNKRCKTFCIVINNVLSIVINIQNTTIFGPVISTGFYTSLLEFTINLAYDYVADFFFLFFKPLCYSILVT